MDSTKRSKDDAEEGSSSNKRQRATAMPFAPLEQLPQLLHEHIASFLPIEAVEAVSQVSKRMSVGAEAARKSIAKVGITGRARVAEQHLYTTDAPDAETRFYFPTSQTGAKEQFPHITRRRNLSLTPHLTDMAAIHHAAMPNSLPPGNYPTRHRYDVDPRSRRLSAPVLPTKSETRKTGTLAPVDPKLGLAPLTYVTPRYKQSLESGKDVPKLGAPVVLTRAQSTVGGNPQHWEGKPVIFESKRR